MPLPTYQILVLSPLSGAVVALFDSTAIYDLRYSRALNDIGVVVITLPSTAIIRAAFTLDCFIEIYRTNTSGVLVKEETYLCRLMHRFIDGDEERFVVGGVSLNHLLARRVIDPDDDPLAAGGYSTKSGAADQVMYDYAYEQAGPGASAARQTPGLSIVPVTGMGLAVGARLRHENLFEQMQLLSKSGYADFYIERYTLLNITRLVIGVVGSDHSYGTHAFLGEPYTSLSPMRGNLTQPSLQYDRRTEKNFVYELGQGQGDTRIVYKHGSTAVTDSIFNRCEFTDDARNVEKSDVPGLILAADATLLDNQAKREFTYQPTGTEPGNIYRLDFDLGDAVMIAWDDITEDARIVNIEVSIAGAEETIKVTTEHLIYFPGS